MRGLVAVCGAVVVLACAPVVASAAEYGAAPVSQTPANGTKIETGERLPLTLTIRNAGSATWTATNPVRIAPSDGSTPNADKPSVFQDDSWQSAGRIVELAKPPVAPNEQASFAFQFRGPPTDAPRALVQYVIPVAEGKAWMDSPVGTAGATWPTNAVHFDLEVVPSAPPTVTIDAAPTAVVAGQSVPVTATGIDNVRVKAIVARIDQQPIVTLSGAAPAQGAVPTTGLAPGAHTLTIAAVDGAGNLGVASAPLTVSADPGLANGAPAGPATLTAGLSSKRRSRLTVGPGRRTQLGGRLRVKGTKTPIAGARLDVQTRVAGSGWRDATAVTTDRLGRYQLRLAAGPSRRVRVRYRAQTLAAPVAERTVRLQTRAQVKLEVGLRGRTLRVRGRVPRGPFPRGGVLVSLQALQRGDGRWRPFKTVRAKGKEQRFRGAQRFDGGGRFRIRAVVNEQAGYPYTRGISKVRRVSVR